MSFRGLFVIDPNGVVRHMSVNDLPVGRSVEETLRLVRAFQFVETHGEVCPASWTPESPTVSSFVTRCPRQPIQHRDRLSSVVCTVKPFQLICLFFQIKPTPQGSKEYFEKVN